MFDAGVFGVAGGTASLSAFLFVQLGIMLFFESRDGRLMLEREADVIQAVNEAFFDRGIDVKVKRNFFLGMKGDSLFFEIHGGFEAGEAVHHFKNGVDLGF